MFDFRKWRHLADVGVSVGIRKPSRSGSARFCARSGRICRDRATDAASTSTRQSPQHASGRFVFDHHRIQTLQTLPRLNFTTEECQLCPVLKDNIDVPLAVPRAYALAHNYSETLRALKRRHCGASQCVSNFGLKFAGRLNSLWRWIGRLGASSVI
jgi:hypothetical protein